MAIVVTGASPERMKEIQNEIKARRRENRERKSRLRAAQQAAGSRGIITREQMMKTRPVVEDHEGDIVRIKQLCGSLGLKLTDAERA